MDILAYPPDRLRLWFSLLSTAARDRKDVGALVGDAILRRSCVSQLAAEPGATLESVSLVASEALSNRIMSNLADVLLAPLRFHMEGASEHARGTRVESAVFDVSRHGSRGLRAIEDVAAFLISVARREVINPRGRVVELRACISTIPDERGWRAIVKLPCKPVCSAVCRVRKDAERAACIEALENIGLSTTEQWVARSRSKIHMQ